MRSRRRAIHRSAAEYASLFRNDLDAGRDKLHDVMLLTSHGKAWASPASKAMIGRDGNLMRDEDSKIRYAPAISFATKELRDRFSAACVAAVLAAHPEAIE